jgi:RHS repeat-associated protein
VISEQVHLPYGTALTAESVSYGTSANPSKKRFTSYERSDATKLDHAVNRQYHAGLGRFTQVDPIEMSAVDIGDPQSLNLYAYCGNDPINHTDPDGLFFKKLFRAIKRFFSNIWVKIALIVALAIITIGVASGHWALIIKLPVKVLKFGLEGITEATIPGVYTTKVTALGWVAAGITAITGASLAASGGFRTPSTFPGGVSDWQRGSKGGGRPPGSGGPRPGPNRYPRYARSRLEAWTYLFRDILNGKRQAPRPKDFPNGPLRSLPPGYNLHHIFPQAFEPQFRRVGVNVHEATIGIPRWLHTQLHSQGPRGGWWNQTWDNFFHNNPNPSRAAVFYQANQMIRATNLQYYPVIQYKN